MDEILAEFEQFQRQNFPNLALGPALFHQWPFGLRFDLGGDLSVAEGRLSQAVDRASAVFEAIGSEHDRSYVVARSYDPEDFFWELLRMLESPRLGVGIRRDASLDSTAEENSVDIILPLTRARFDHRALFEAITNTDHARSPRLNGPVFIVNAANQTVFHMYDDRGADLIAAKKETIAPIYQRFSDWLLNYDRQKMDACFA